MISILKSNLYDKKIRTATNLEKNELTEIQVLNFTVQYPLNLRYWNMIECRPRHHTFQFL